MERRSRVAWAATAVAAVLAGAFATPVAAVPKVWTYPGCGGAPTLQACIDGTSPGDVIQLAANDLASDEVLVSRSLTLRPKAGFHPTVGRVVVDDMSAGGAIDIVVQDMAIRRVSATFSGGTGHRLTLRRLVVVPPANGSSQANISLQSTVPSAFVVTGTRLRITGDTANGIELYATHTFGTVTARLVGNRISGEGNDRANQAIFIGAENNGSGSLHADVYNNSIYKVEACCSLPAAVWINVEFDAVADVNIVGNTIERSGGGALLLRTLEDPGGGLSADVFDNIFSRSAGAALWWQGFSPSALHLRAGFNDYWANDQPDDLGVGHSTGTGNLHVAPGFLDAGAGDLRLRPTSALIDRGVLCSPGGIGRLDAAGHHRLAGTSVDMGAYERGAGAPSGRVVLGGPGPDSLPGGPGPDIICGYGGADDIDGEGGADYLDGGSGPDLIAGRSGHDRLFGRDGDDQLCARDGVGGNDDVSGGRGHDRYTADRGDGLSGLEHQGGCPH
jgi:hypothetical protein